MLGSTRVASQLVASRVVLNSIELVSYLINENIKSSSQYLYSTIVPIVKANTFLDWTRN
jgi:hypothetical protein